MIFRVENKMKQSPANQASIALENFRRAVLAAAKIATVLLGLFMSTQSSWAEYRLASGDVVEISVFGVQEFKQRSTVSLDGKIALPLLGEVQAAGLILDELRAKLKQALIENKVIRNPDVTVDIAQHRPFFINGDIAKPGAHPFQPGLTVRHAVAIAGGYDVMRFRVDNPLIVAAELRSQYDALWTDYVRREARVTSLRAELDQKKELDLSALEEAPIATRIIQEITKLEIEFFDSRKSDHILEKEHLGRALQHAKSQVFSLKLSREQEVKGVEIQSESVARTTSLRDKGLVPVTRLAEEQRGAVLQKSRELEISARLSDAERQMNDVARKVESVDDDRRMKLLRELQDAVVELERVRSQLQGIGEKLLYIGAIKSQLRRGGRSDPDIVIYRNVDGEQKRLVSDEGSEVQPGDVIDVMFSQRQLMLSGGQ
jgi:polysaccharide export outer membrane protein